jgi:hypothetical protein
LKALAIFRTFATQSLINKTSDMITIEQLKDVKERVEALRRYL